MRIAYLTSYDSTDVRNWSGLGYYIGQSLEKQGVELVRINCAPDRSVLQRAVGRFNRIVSGKIQQPERANAQLKQMAEKAVAQLRKAKYDLIFAAGSLPITYLNADKPVVIFTDATYDCMMSLYVDKAKLSDYSIAQGNWAEGSAIHRASMLIYTSAWAADSAVNLYKADPEKVRVLNFGANLQTVMEEEAVQGIIGQRLRRTPVRLLFMGVDWHRKGAPEAIETVAKLNFLGIPASLTIVGCEPPDGFVVPDFVSCHPFIPKSQTHGRQRLHRLFEQADFFLLPTKADCTPVVFSEAAAYGLPVITTGVGGVRSVVLDGATGFCCRANNFVDDAVGKIAGLYYDRIEYQAFCERAYQHYKNELSWDVFGQRLTAAFDEVLQQTSNKVEC